MAYATFADLPPEMVGNVFAFIRSKSHQSSVCLVSRTWRDQIRPIMWEKIETDFRDASAPSLATLLHPQSGITGHIRELDICESAKTTDGDYRAILVITAIPRDRLRRFESTCKVSALTFQVLLQSQRRIEDIDIGGSFSTPDQPTHESLNLSNLKGLHIEWCIDQIPLLEGISSFYTHNAGQLEELIIALPTRMENPKHTVQAIDTLLKTCPKLTYLQLDLSVHGLVARDSVLVHCKTLTELMMESGMTEGGNYFPIADITAILKACTKLTALAIDMPTLELGCISDPPDGFSLDEDYAHVLAAVATQPVLKAFRILSLPVLEFDDPSSERPTGRDTLFCQVVMQNLANQILRFATDRGSKLKVLSIKPSLEPVDLNSGRDTNGHKWPEYHYIRGRVSDITSTDVVVAHPSKSVILDFPDLEPLLHYI
ncbi:hypothetical protein J4E93_010462 [Alternaria ventricosa]|uniref:uncharacterized protein n=1 Tax=Alternaria ventricosa TaxID=1187951 RepID=UPI0020C3C289|nr:uncharacterized protein J4E93_010462 [Alternaria ventricosa]KAI4638152.1 hypothetical protein J4E93_010462 [Alternaria ventricosa]